MPPPLLQLLKSGQKTEFPLLLTSPVNEAYWPGQSQQMFDMLTCPNNWWNSPRPTAPDLHCEPKGMGIRDLRIFNWLDKTMSLRG